MKEEIKAWLQGPRVYLEGVALYDKFGVNKMLKASFNRGNTQALMDMLVYELITIAGISELEAATMPRYAKKTILKTEPQIVKTEKVNYVDDLILSLADTFHVSVDELFTTGTLTTASEEQLKAIEILAPVYAQVPETMKKVIRLRETYPFLKDANCPDELKLLVHDMLSAYDRYRDAHPELSDKNTQDENLRLAAEVVESYLDNRAMWEELDYYKENGVILGKHEMFDLIKMRVEITAMADMDIISKLNKTKPNITKAKNALAKADTDEKKEECFARLDKWTVYVSELEAEIERRKK